MARLSGTRVAFLGASEGIEQVELEQPWDAVRSARGEPQLVAPEAGTAPAFDHLDEADTSLVEADVVRGRALTSWPSTKTDIRNAGGTWVDEEIHVDRGLITSRKPDDLPACCATLVGEVAQGHRARQAAAVSR